MKRLCGGPVSAGFGTEILTFFRATGLKKVADGGGDHSEDITIHEIPLKNVKRWLLSREDEQTAIDPKVFTGLYFLK
jgi:ADP-ribose pyrophosphatase